MHKGKYDNVGIIWIDAHPDVSTVNDGYPNAHAMVLGSLMGQGAMQIVTQMRNPVFKPDEILYVGLQPLHDYQEAFLKKTGVNYKVQDQDMTRFDHILCHKVSVYFLGV